MSDLIGRVFRRRELQGDEYDVVRIVGFIRSEEVTEPVMQPVAHGESVKVDAEKFAQHYTSVGVKQIERAEPEGGRYGWGDVAGSAARGEPTQTDYAALLEDDPADDAKRRLAALEDTE